VEVHLDPGGNGVFDVFVDEDVVFSKHKAGRFPFEDEILAHFT